jgi:hypothetical protein
LIEDDKIINVVNFTIKDTKYLEFGIDLINNAWRFMTNTDKTFRSNFKSLNIGGIRSLEVKIGKNSGEWHPHLHTLVVKDKRSKDFEDYKRLWENSLKSVVKTDEKIGSVFCRGLGSFQSVNAGIVETVKYITKFDWYNFSSEQVTEMVHTLAGRRTISTWGILRKMQQEVEEECQNDYETVEDKTCKICGNDVFDLFNKRTDSVDSQSVIEFD